MISMKHMSLSNRWLTFWLSAFVLPIIIFAGWTVFSINQLLNEQATRMLQADKQFIELFLHQQVQEQIQIARLFAYRQASGEKMSYYSSLHTSLGESESKIWYPKSGHMTVLGEELLSLKQIKELEQGKDITGGIFLREHSNEVVVVGKVRHFSGMAVSVQRFQIDDILDQPENGGRKKWQVKGLANHHLQANSNVSSSLYSPNVNEQPIHEMLDGEHFLSVYLPLKDPNGNTVAYLAVSESMSPIDAIRLQRLMITLLILAVGALGVWLLASRFRRDIIGPMQALSEMSTQIASGKLDERLLLETQHQEMKRTLENYNKMLHLLEEQEQLRANFIANLTHDFRTPLLAQERALELISEEMRILNQPPLENLCDSILQNNKHLLLMVNQLLETYQFDKGKLQFENEPVHIDKIVKEAVSQVLPLAESKKIVLRLVINEELPSAIGDSAAILRVIINLVANSIMVLHNEGQITIKVEAVDSFICIHVKDNGPGIDPSDLPYIFDKYYAGKSHKRKLGSGFGLYICNALVMAQGGNIEVESQLGSYTHFKVYFQKAKDAPQ